MQIIEPNIVRYIKVIKRKLRCQERLLRKRLNQIIFQWVVCQRAPIQQSIQSTRFLPSLWKITISHKTEMWSSRNSITISTLRQVQIRLTLAKIWKAINISSPTEICFQMTQIIARNLIHLNIMGLKWEENEKQVTIYIWTPNSIDFI